MEERRVVVRLTPLGRRLGLLAVSLAPLAVVYAALGSAANFESGASAGALAFLCLLLLAVLAFARLRARSGIDALEVVAPDPVCADEGEAVLLPLDLRHGGGRRLRDLEVLSGHARMGLARTIGYVDALAPRQRVRAACGWRLARRGRWRELRLSVASAQPFGLVEARLELVLAADVLALPRRLAPGLLPAVPPAGHGSHEARRRRVRGSAELRGLRRWREGEDQRLVHWKVSARSGQLVLRELEGEERGVLRIFLVARGRSGGEGFEEAVRVVATLARDALARHPEVRTAVLGASRREAPVVRGRSDLFELFAFLAEVEGSDESAIDPLAVAREARERGELALFVFDGGTWEPPRALRAVAIDAASAEARA